ncbi:MAG: universal stress protein [Leptolyngbya sp. SIO1D8]|nr:universal stress protein [Leptolyngbya sp. SIO1D8]
MYQRILVALGEDDAINEKVVAEATAISRVTKGTLNLLSVFFPRNLETPESGSTDRMLSDVTTETFQLFMSDWSILQPTSQEFARDRGDRFSVQGITVEWTQAVGEPGRQICNIAKDWKADLIMLGLRQRIGFEEFLLGSVSNYVMHHAPCSVMTVQEVGEAVLV